MGAALSLCGGCGQLQLDYCSSGTSPMGLSPELPEARRRRRREGAWGVDWNTVFIHDHVPTANWLVR